MIEIEIGNLYKLNLTTKEKEVDVGNGTTFRYQIQFVLDKTCPPNIYLVLEENEKDYKTLQGDKIHYIEKGWAKENFILIEENNHVK